VFSKSLKSNTAFSSIIGSLPDLTKTLLTLVAFSWKVATDTSNTHNKFNEISYGITWKFRTAVADLISSRILISSSSLWDIPLLAVMTQYNNVIILEK
jgi:hypothetical protein